MMKNITIKDIKGIVDTPDNVATLKCSGDLLELCVMGGKAKPLVTLAGEFTGWYRREIGSSPVCQTPGNGYILFSENPLVVKRLEASGPAASYRASVASESFAIDNTITEIA
jgi:hypothetical protein